MLAVRGRVSVGGHLCLFIRMDIQPAQGPIEPGADQAMYNPVEDEPVEGDPAGQMLELQRRYHEEVMQGLQTLQAQMAAGFEVMQVPGGGQFMLLCVIRA